MPTLNIKDPAIYEAVRKLSSLQGTTMTQAVRSAVEQALQAELRRHEERRAALDAFLEAVRADGPALVSDSELYDDNGLPIG